MEALPTLLLSFLAVWVTSSAFALECPACSSVPGFGTKKCDGDEVETITCAADLDRCMTADLKMSVSDIGSFSYELKNCSNSFLCDPGSAFYLCKIINSTGVFTSCEVTCYEPSKSVPALA